MDLNCDCAESPAVEQPSGKINKTAFKLFGKRKSGSPMPSIFGVRNKGDGKNAGKMGMVRSKTLDGLADVVLESSKKEEQAAADTPSTDTNSQAVTTATKTDVSPNSPVGKSHSFFTLLKRNGRLENVKGDNVEQIAGSRQKKGLKGLFNSMRWNRKEKNYKEDKEGATESQPGLILSGSLTASLECIKEEIQKPLCEPKVPAETVTDDLPIEEQSEVVNNSAEKHQLKANKESPSSSHPTDKPQDGNAASSPQVDRVHQPPEPEVETLQDKKDESLTGCGDIIAEPDDEGGSSSSSTCARIILGNGKKAIPKKTPNIIVYQGGGEEMASPDQVDDKDMQEFLGIIPQAEDTSKEVGKVSRQASREDKSSESTCDGNGVKPYKLRHTATHSSDKGDLRGRGKEQRDSVRNSDEGYWDSTTPGLEEEPPKSSGKKALSRDSCSGDALYDLYTETDENTARAHVEEKRPSQLHSKALSPVTVTCPTKTSLAKESKIPRSIKHLPVHPPSQPADTGSTSTPTSQHPPTKSELPRTKIPVSKVLVRRVSNKTVTGTSGKTAFHDPARK
ncbi:PREDICTED: APC membrane recruitment protein 2 [Nanorana parkeri]|uniref:APC membrane recruitment protein 2 n=1 Tax=Nanorana parkeri TaxID=125878 RepID=UPI00085425A9|nr:PREDICTED: APC membrane recruitment protein 2 [Nanorana parkeri]